MAVSKSFAEHAIDLLSGAGRIESRPMFGGYGIFHRGAMFALLDDDELYLKADDENRQAFVGAACRQWTYPGAKGPMPMGYYRPPDDAMESSEAMLPWARLGIDAAERVAQAKALKAAKAKLKQPEADAPAKQRAVKPKAGAKPKAAVKAKVSAKKPKASASSGAASKKAKAAKKASGRKSK